MAFGGFCVFTKKCHAINTFDGAIDNTLRKNSDIGKSASRTDLEEFESEYEEDLGISNPIHVAYIFFIYA